MTESMRIDELAQRSGLTVDTIRYYQRECLLPPAVRAGRSKLYGPDHLDRLAQIRDLQGRRFSLAAIRALLESERPELVDGIFSGEGSIAYSPRRPGGAQRRVGGAGGQAARGGAPA